jgi:hypothetical protein
MALEKMIHRPKEWKREPRNKPRSIVIFGKEYTMEKRWLLQ